jgi:hypothetical protein
LGWKPANAAEMFDDRAERGHHTDCVVVKLDGAWEVRRTGLHGDLRRINREGKCGRDRVIGPLLYGMTEHDILLHFWVLLLTPTAQDGLRCHGRYRPQCGRLASLDLMSV